MNYTINYTNKEGIVLRFTMKEIATGLNLSVSTISRVLANKDNVNEQTREQVLQYMKERHYPLPSCHKEQSVLGQAVAVMIPDLTEDYFAHVIRGIEDILWQEKCTMMLCETMEDPAKEEQYIDTLKSKKIMNIILATVSKDQERIRGYLKDGLNIVFFDNLPNVSVNYNSVITDNVRASIMAVDHLASMGHTDIGIIAGKQEETTGFERLVGYRRAMDMRGIAVDEGLIAVGDFKEESGYQCMVQLLDRNPGITAVYVSSAKMTYGAMKAILDKGLRIPEDIAMVGFDVHDATELIRPGITTILQNEADIGRLCVELLFKKESKVKNGERMLYQRILLEPNLMIRESCGYKRHMEQTAR
jgi:LacI family transcriptional regulator